LPAALECLTRSLSMEPRHKFAIFYRAMVYEKMGKFDQALKDLDERLSYSDTYDIDDQQAKFLRARIKVECNNYESALEDLNNILSFRPDQPDALRLKQVIEQKIARRPPSLSVAQHSLLKAPAKQPDTQDGHPSADRPGPPP
jgi:tetratricopeptide (TPR) repeat protein